MNVYIFFVCFCFIILGCKDSGKNQNTIDAEKLFIEWNKGTLRSLQRQIGTAEPGLKELLENRLEAFKVFNEIDESSNVINFHSVRYLFLNELKNNSFDRINFYILEEKRLGERVEIRNYVLYNHSGDSANVDVYKLENGEWSKRDSGRIIQLTLKETLKGYFTDFGKGSNNDDIILTQVKDLEVMDSEYYLYATLSYDAKIALILESQR